MKLNQAYYLQDDVVFLAKDLIGKILYTQIDGNKCAGIITETEAYAGATDKASHAYNNRRTARTEPMFARGGIAYVYLCYGMYHLFNVVTGEEGTPHAVLIRSIVPYQGLDTMLKRRNASHYHQNLLNGPGKISIALGIHQACNNLSLQGNTIWIEDKHLDIDITLIKATPRIGVNYAKEDALLPYRFVLQQKLTHEYPRLTYSTGK